MVLNGLDLFSGIGGITHALQDWVRPIAYCESDRYAQSVLLSAMQRSYIPYAPIWDDVRTLRSKHLDVSIDIIYGGFPCQDISVAGDGQGLEGKRSGLFFEITRLTSELRPQFVFLENVPAITIRGLDRILLEFTTLGYDCRWTIVSAAELGAPHLRERWFLLAHSNGNGVWNESNRIPKLPGQTVSSNQGKKESMADTISTRPQGTNRPVETHSKPSGLNRSQWWETESPVGRMANGIRYRPHRIRALGNAVVPNQAKEAFERLIGLKCCKKDTL